MPHVLPASPVPIKRLPPGPEREELRFASYQFEDARGHNATNRPKYGLNPEVLPNNRVPVSFLDGSRSNYLGGESFPSRLLKAQGRKEPWTTHATLENVNRLPERYRAAMRLFYWENMDHEEICKLLGLKETPQINTCSLWAMLHRARKRLQNLHSRNVAQALRVVPLCEPLPLRVLLLRPLDNLRSLLTGTFQTT